MGFTARIDDIKYCNVSLETILSALAAAIRKDKEKKEAEREHLRGGSVRQVPVAGRPNNT